MNPVIKNFNRDFWKGFFQREYDIFMYEIYLPFFKKEWKEISTEDKKLELLKKALETEKELRSSKK